MAELTKEQKNALAASGKVIVSASAGSGKTFVMIEKIVAAIVGGADVDEILAVTFTNKAAAQIKEKLRKALIEKMNGTSGELHDRLKLQISKIPAANVSTIHAFCARLLRTYFYVLGIDGGFDIIFLGDGQADEYLQRAADELFERLYAEGGESFKLLLKCFVRRRSDYALRRHVMEAHAQVRTLARYEKLLENVGALFTEDGFDRVCAELSANNEKRLERMICAVQSFRKDFKCVKNKKIYDETFDEMCDSAYCLAKGGIFAEKRAFVTRKKPTDPPEEKAEGERFKAFRDEMKARYEAIRGDYSTRENELDYFLKSGKIATAFADVVLQFDRQYAEVLRDENKLDCNDLEHLTLELLKDESVKADVNAKYKYVFVDEYQDVNPVQEEIISAFTGEVFLVGDIKQAIYGFRGSKSRYFAEKFSAFGSDGGSALRLSSNFRSADGVIKFVNELFTQAMQEDNCGINYLRDGAMQFGGGYPADEGEAKILTFGKEEKAERELKIYSVKEDGRSLSHTREGLAVLKIVENELKRKRFDLKSGEYVDVQPGDICILTRKNKNPSTDGIVRALLDEGYSLSGAQEANACLTSEVKQFLDILSLIDNAEQDMPLVSALLSPIGDMCENELAEIRIALKSKGDATFRQCCRLYAEKMRGEISKKLVTFYKNLDRLRSLAEILTTGELADEILEGYGVEAAYGTDAQKLKNVLKLVEEGADLPLAAFLNKIKTGGYDVKAPQTVSADSINIMSMHASKGLEFPVVILADACRTFKGQDYAELPFDEDFGFAPKCYDVENALTYNTVLRRLFKQRSDADELKNELNLFYVACTRAMNRLYILAEKQTEWRGYVPDDARCFADVFDMAKFSPVAAELHDEFSASADRDTLLFKPDENTVREIEKRFMADYAFDGSVNLPVKSSASAILRLKEKEPYYTERALFGGEGETGTERGTAYHRFLELCDFEVKSEQDVKAQAEEFLNDGRITKEQYELLDFDNLSKILQMPVFGNLKSAQLFREREFLCRLPAREILPDTSADDYVLVQGAIDLLAVGERVKIIDYKYSVKDDGALVQTYAPQLALYKRAVSAILKIPTENIDCTIVNIFKLRQIDL